MRVLIIEQDGSIIIRQPTGETSIEDLQKATPGSVIVDSSFLPEDREFRDAWTVTGINLDRAKKIWADKIRKKRAIRFLDLDLKWMKAMERGDVKIAASIASEKQVLRDLTEREELQKAESLQEIKNFWPDILEG